MKYLATVLVGLLLGSCSGGMSRQIRDEATAFGSFEELRGEPDRFIGQIVILGGEIVEVRNRPDSTVLVLLERPLGLDRRPKTTDQSGGRYLLRFPRYLDPVVFAVGRLVTVGGRVSGTETEFVGEARYQYVVLEGQEIRLWNEYESFPPFYYYYPFYPYDPYFPYYYPRYRSRPHRR